MDEIPTDDEMAEVYNSLMSLSARYGMIYGSPSQTINKVLRFWGKLGLQELEKIEAMKYEPRMKAPTFPIYDENCNIIG
jgi:hypothetical protein